MRYHICRDRAGHQREQKSIPQSMLHAARVLKPQTLFQGFMDDQLHDFLVS